MKPTSKRLNEVLREEGDFEIMSCPYCKKAKALEANENQLEKALTFCDKGIAQGCIDCAYEKGLLLELQKPVDWGKVIAAFEIGEKKGEKRCKHELAMIYAGERNPEVKDYDKALDRLHHYVSDFADAVVIIKILPAQWDEVRKRGLASSLPFYYKWCCLSQCDSALDYFVKNKLIPKCKKELWPSFEEKIQTADSLSSLREFLEPIFLGLKSKYGINDLFVRCLSKVVDLMHIKGIENSDAEWFLSKYLSDRTLRRNFIKELVKNIEEGWLAPAKILLTLMERYPGLKEGVQAFVDAEVSRLTSLGDFDKIATLLKRLKIPPEKYPDYLIRAERRSDYRETETLVAACLDEGGWKENGSKALDKTIELFEKYKSERLFHRLVTQLDDIKAFELLKAAFAKAALNGIILTEEEKKIQMKIAGPQPIKEQSKKCLIIFSYDLIYLSSGAYVNNANFDKIFKSPSSPFYYGNNDVAVLDLTANLANVPKQLLPRSSLNAQFVFSKKAQLNLFLLGKRNDYRDIFAFCYDEAELLVCVESGIKSYFVNKRFGYPMDPAELELDFARSLIPNVRFGEAFRNDYLYYYSAIATNPFCDYSPTNHFNGIVVYFKAFNASKRELNAPYRQGNREVVKEFRKGEFDGERKLYTLTKNTEEFVKWFEDLPIKKDDVVMRVPGSKETSVDAEKPMNKIVEKIIESHGRGINGNKYLLRSRVKKSHNDYGGRILSEQLDSLVVIDDKRELLGRTIYLFDDICTSGTSMIACSHLLYEAGASRVLCFAVVKTWNSKYPLESIE